MQQKCSLIIIVFVAFIVVSAGCINQQPQPDKYTYSIKKYGIEFVFTNPIENASLVTASNEAEIYQALLAASNVIITFQPDETDNIAFQLAGVEIASKLSHFYVYGQGSYVGVEAKKMPLYNITASTTVILMKGPNTGATDTSVYMDPLRRIIVEGTTQKNLTLAADRLALVYLEDE